MSLENLYGLLGNYEGIGNLAQQAQQINQAFAQGQIAPEEHAELLADLIRTHNIIVSAEHNEQAMFADKLIKVLSSLPLP